MSTIEEQFEQVLIEDCNTCTRTLKYNPTRTRELIGRLGGVGAVKNLMARYPDPNGYSDGFEKLCLAGRLDLSLEAKMLKSEFQSLFTPEELELARKRLAVYDYFPALE